jgi:hypothetical protein
MCPRGAVSAGDLPGGCLGAKCSCVLYHCVCVFEDFALVPVDLGPRSLCLQGTLEGGCLFTPVGCLVAFDGRPGPGEPRVRPADCLLGALSQIGYLQAEGFGQLVQLGFALVLPGLALVGDPVALVSDPVALVSGPVALVSGPVAVFIGRPELVVAAAARAVPAGLHIHRMRREDHGCRA